MNRAYFIRANSQPPHSRHMPCSNRSAPALPGIGLSFNLRRSNPMPRVLHSRGFKAVRMMLTKSGNNIVAGLIGMTFINAPVVCPPRDQNGSTRCARLQSFYSFHTAFHFVHSFKFSEMR